MKDKFTLGAFGIILDKQQRILLCHRRDMDLWNLPGGGVEKGESPWEGCVREVNEETGLKVEVVKLHGVYYKDRLKDEIVFSFLCRCHGGKLRVNNEADNLKYFYYKEIPRNFSPNQKERISDFMLNRERLVLKKQTGISSKFLINQKKR